MRTLITVSIPVEVGTKVVADGSIGRVFQEFTEKNRPESLYFSTANGQRTVYAVVDVQDASQFPVICEPLYAAFNATIDLVPVMTAEDVQAGVRNLQQSR